MKKSTLLVGLAMLGGFAAAEAQETVNGLKISTDTQKYYYRISNMRVQRLDYATGCVAGFNEETGEADWEDVYMMDNWAKAMPLFTPNGFPEDLVYGSADYTSIMNSFVQGGSGVASEILEENGYDKGTYTLTPQPYQYPYLGLVIVDDNFWTAFSAQPEVMDPDTAFWYFTSTDGKKVQIHNAVIQGTIKRNAGAVLGRYTMGFDTAENNYYVLPLKELFEEENFEMSFSEHQYETCFALSTTATVTNTSGSCLDANNHIAYNYEAPQVDPATGEPVLNEETEEPINLRYGFVGMNRTWSPLRTNGSNDNHLYNNGSTFFVDEATEEEANAAIERYKEVVAETYRKGAVTAAKNAYLAAGQEMEGWKNVPALWKDQEKLNALIQYCENWDGDAKEVTDLASQEAYIAAAEKNAAAKVIEGAQLVGSGAIVTFQNLLALRDRESADAMDEDEIEEYQMGNAYISAGCPGTYNSGTMEEADYTGIAPKLVADANCEWELMPVAGTKNFLLYNAATKTYIRKYVDMYEYAGGEEELGETANNFSWATTDDVTMAAPFYFIACADPEAQTITENEEIIIEDYEISTDITNNVRLFTKNTVAVLDEEGNPTVDEATGEPVYQTTTYGIHRASGSYGYTFVNWNAPAHQNWFADSNVFNIGVVKEGGINEISADNVKATGIYDLQGRRVSKADKGLYIINGVKTIVH